MQTNLTGEPEEGAADAEDDGDASKYEFELYKTLTKERSVYLDRVPSLWLQKFVLLGALVTFVITNQSQIETLAPNAPLSAASVRMTTAASPNLPNAALTAPPLEKSVVASAAGADRSGRDLVAWVFLGAILAIPSMAILVDMKMLEYMIHARVTSRFIAAKFASGGKPAVLREWENYLYGVAADADDRLLIELRGLLTVVVTAAPTVVTLILSTLLVDALHRRGYAYLPWWLGIAGSVVYLGFTVWLWRRLWRISKSAAGGDRVLPFTGSPS